MCTMSVQYQQRSEERIGSPGTRATCNCMDTGNKSKSSSRAVNASKLLTLSSPNTYNLNYHIYPVRKFHILQMMKV